MPNQLRHKYDYEIDLNSETTGARIIRLIGNKKRVLELGAGPGSITKHLKNESECEIIAIENDKDAIEKLSNYCEKIYDLNLNNNGWEKELRNEDKFDVVLAADVLEHLHDPWSVLNSMKSLLNEEGCIIVSIPHIGHNAVLASILEYDFEYRQWGLLDRTHIRFFAIRNIQELFNSAKLRIDKAEFVVIQPELTELANNWRKLSKNLKNALSENKYGMVYQVIVKTLPENDKSKGIDLTCMDVQSIKINNSQRLKSIINTYLPNSMREVLRRIVHRMRK